MGCLQSQSSMEMGESNKHVDVTYSHQVTFQIKDLSRDGRVDGEDRVPCALTTPSTFQSLGVKIGSQNCHLTTCVLPGLDPRGNYIKECQDGVYCVQNDKGFLAVLMDGHGGDGLKIVTACIAEVADYFAKHSADFENDPQRSIEELCFQCDAKVKTSSELDCSLSGTTAIVLYANEQGLHVGSVGDSRAIMGSLAQGERQVAIPEKKDNRYFRAVTSERAVDAIQLTLDQKPNHIGEMDRIQKSGGRVAKITDQFGKLVGPYRVWEMFGSLPGLAMSRSIGDRMASNVGVICTPVFNYFEVFRGTDLFVVLASDGVWDAMTNVEVVNFIEKYRNQASKSPTFRTVKGKLRVSNTTIAHLLCEEARYRWIGICNDEDVMIDDISCIVLEFPSQPVTAGKRNVPNRSVQRAMSLGPDDDPRPLLEGKHVDSRGTLVDNEGPDHLIQSDVTPKSPPHKSLPPTSTSSKPTAAERKSMMPAAVRNDFLRGSIAKEGEQPATKRP